MIPADLIARAASAVVSNQLATVSLISRELEVGVAVADQLMTALEELSVVGPPRGRMSRTILVPVERLPQVLDKITRGAA